MEVLLESVVEGTLGSLLLLAGVIFSAVAVDRLLMFKARSCEGKVVSQGSRSAYTGPTDHRLTERYVVVRYVDHAGRQRTFEQSDRAEDAYLIGEMVQVRHRRRWPRLARVVKDSSAQSADDGTSR